MKAVIALICIFVSISAIASTIPDFFCETTKEENRIEVRYVDGNLSYDNGRSIDIAVASKSNNDKVLKVSGLSKGLIFAGGGRQSVSVTLNLKTKKGSLSIFTKTFYRQKEVNEDLICSL